MKMAHYSHKPQLIQLCNKTLKRWKNYSSSYIEVEVEVIAFTIK